MPAPAVAMTALPPAAPEQTDAIDVSPRGLAPRDVVLGVPRSDGVAVAHHERAAVQDPGRLDGARSAGDTS